MAAHYAVCELNLAALRIERAVAQGKRVDTVSATNLIMIQMFCETANRLLQRVAERLDLNPP